mgnify:FL=1
MNIAIIEDSKADSAVLLALLDQFFAKYDFTPGIDTYGDAENVLTAFEPGKYDLCFMDIHLPGMNGMDAARQIYKKDSNLKIIFLTCTNQYMADGYCVRALRYLLKPISMVQLNDFLPEYIEDFTQKTRRLTVQIYRKDYEISFSKIYYIKSSVKTEIHLKDNVYLSTARKSFSDIVAPLLTDSRFITCSRGIVVNMSHVVKITQDCFLMTNGAFVPISRRRFQSVRNSFINFQLKFYS